MSIFQYGGGGGSSMADALILDYLPSVDLMIAVAVDSAPWHDICPDQPFSVDPGAAFVEISVGGIVRVGGTSAGGYVITRLVVDSAAAPKTYPLSATNGPENAASYANALDGSSVIAIPGLSAGVHTAKAQVLSTYPNTAYCEPLSESPWEFFRMQVIERF